MKWLETINYEQKWDKKFVDLKCRASGSELMKRRFKPTSLCFKQRNLLRLIRFCCSLNRRTSGHAAQPSWSKHNHTPTQRSPKDAPAQTAETALDRCSSPPAALFPPPLSAGASWRALERCRERGGGPERERESKLDGGGPILPSGLSIQ